MRNRIARHVTAMAVIVALTDACAGNAGVPSGAASFQAQSAFIDDGAKPTNLSGQYAGTVKDSVDGSGKAKASVAQYKSALGGSESIAYALGSMKASLVSSVDVKALNGTTVVVSKGVVCSFSTTATYATKTRLLTGSYHAVSGCTGEKGTFRLKHQCVYKGTGDASVVPETGIHGC